MTGFINNIAELGRSTWNLFCTAPVLCIVIAIGLAIAGICTYHFIRDVVWTDKGGPIILR